MGYQLRMHREIRDRLTGLRGGEPELARLVGEAVLALLDAGESLGPPLVVPLESVLQRPDDPREALDYSYQRQLERLTKVRRGVADVATSHKRIELQADTLEQQAGKLAGQRERALEAGRADLAREAQMREASVREQLAGLREQLLILTAEEEKLTAASSARIGWSEVLVDVKTWAVPAVATASRSKLRPMPDRRRSGSTIRSSMKSRP
jgi:hypothetical protein